MDIESKVARGSLPIILIAAVVQGWSLFALHQSILHKSWPFTSPGVLLALYAVAVLIPLSVQRLSSLMRLRSAWTIVAILAVAFALFGAHHGAFVLHLANPRDDLIEQSVPFGFVLGVLWLLIFPFIETRLALGRWRAAYADWFSSAWNNKLVLAEAALFTGVFWLLLLLMQELFFMLGIGFFRTLFFEPLFIYPVTSITFGVALHLIGSLERLTTVVLEQLLNVLKWLAVLAGIILTLFTIALAIKLPGLIATGERVIGAAWLLWLIAVIVLLLNAAYRDGTSTDPYPRVLGTVIRWVVPLLVVVSFTALYAMVLRVSRYGFTVERVWACIVACVACLYSIGYAYASRDKHPWMANIAKVNVAVALVLICVLALALTPVLSPYRIAAASQYQQIVNEWPPAQSNSDSNAMSYLQTSSGNYGRRRLQQLATITNVPNAEAIRADASDALEMDLRWVPHRSPNRIEQSLAQLTVRPSDDAVDETLRQALQTHLTKPENNWLAAGDTGLSGLFVDLNEDGKKEFVLVSGATADVFEHNDSGWRWATRFGANAVDAARLTTAVANGEVEVVAPTWKELQIGTTRFRNGSYGQ